MVEGLDMAGTGEDQAGDNRRPETPDTDLQGTALEVPIEVQTMITRTTDTDMAEGDLNSGIPAEEDMADSDSCGSDDTGSSASEPTPQWLQRAISLCSEGEDIEVLAAAADEDELFGELEYPKAFSDVEEDDLGSPLHLSYKIHDSSSENFADISQDDLDNSILSNGSDEALHKDGKSGSQQSQTKISSEEKFQGQTKLTKNNSRNGHSEDTELSVMNRPDTIPPSKSDTDLNSYSKDAHSSLESDRVSTPPEGKSCVLTTHDIAEMTSNGESDYLFVAAHTIRKALDCEVNGRYEEAFNLYRACVSLLLSGVQGEQDVKRRDAVRRKTAQYLLKAEALYTAYVHDLQKSEASSDQDQDKPNHVVTEGPSHTHMTSPQGAHKYKSITLSNLKVIGITGKVMLVENPDISETFIMKVLHKSEGHNSRRSSKSHDHRKRKLLKRAYATCPFMVRLYSHYETANSIFLLLEHARGGRLWDYLSGFIRPIESQQYVLSTTDSQDAVRTNSLGDDLDKVNLEECVGNDLDVKFPQSRYSRTPSPIPGNSSGHSKNTTIRSRNGVSSGTNKTEGTESRKGSSLFARLDEYFNSSPCHVPEEYIRTWMAEVVLALSHLHSTGIICRDLNPHNLLLDESGHILLTYFSVWDEVERHVDESAREQRYCAPELSSLEEVRASADWWSVGVLMYELLMGKTFVHTHPWGFHSHSEITFSEHISKEAKSLIRELLRVTPSERLGSGVNGVEDIKSHPFFAEVNWRTLGLLHTSPR
ncbi:predicted protein [Nematostella vectensis]|uniref:Protein kinase domain-containing protein n=1 Tax=Nematostella vectensis TaxID=45351 RepID=A7SVK8_NEMVE|nr:predicted protein [Nematostella vectensis]|eukprot:XP_001624367.1 predicted protein [Nematostella vectensis]